MVPVYIMHRGTEPKKIGGKPLQWKAYNTDLPNPHEAICELDAHSQQQTRNYFIDSRVWETVSIQFEVSKHARLWVSLE